MNTKKFSIINIKELVGILPNKKLVLRGNEMNNISTIENAFIKIKDGIIEDYGLMRDFQINDKYSVFDAKGKIVLPSWNDSHTHLVFAGTREKEFIDRINGLSYEEIAARGGGILNSANLLEINSEDDLFSSSCRRLEEVIKMGTGAIEIKSGYGLSLVGELKMLRVIKRLQESYDIPIKSTFLGAHALPKKYKNNKDQYINLIVNEMLPNIKEEGLADYIDVFCETNYFSVDDMQKVIEAGHKYGLKPKVHVNQFTSIGGIQKAIEWNAISVDHLEIMSENDLNEAELQYLWDKEVGDFDYNLDGYDLHLIKILLEEYVSRDGTDYGLVEVTIDEKTKILREQLERGELSILFDEETQEFDIVMREQMEKFGAG